MNLIAHSKHSIHYIVNYSKRDGEFNCGKKKEIKKSINEL